MKTKKCNVLVLTGTRPTDRLYNELIDHVKYVLPTGSDPTRALTCASVHPVEILRAEQKDPYSRKLP